MSKVVYITNNPFKRDEVALLSKALGLDIEVRDGDVRELQTMDKLKLIKHKTVQAFKLVRRPVIVDHASLEIDCLNEMPGTLTQLFWDKLEGKICDIVNALGTPSAKAICTLGYCNGHVIEVLEGSVKGTIAPAPYAVSRFQWDSIFIPDGETRTFTEIKASDKAYVNPHRQIAFSQLKGRI